MHSAGKARRASMVGNIWAMSQRRQTKALNVRSSFVATRVQILA